MWAGRIRLLTRQEPPTSAAPHGSSADTLQSPVQDDQAASAEAERLLAHSTTVDKTTAPLMSAAARLAHAEGYRVHVVVPSHWRVVGLARAAAKRHDVDASFDAGNASLSVTFGGPSDD